MRTLVVFVLSVLLSACTLPEGARNELRSKDIRLETDNPAFKAAQYLNFNERTHREELKELTELFDSHGNIDVGLQFREEGKHFISHVLIED